MASRKWQLAHEYGEGCKVYVDLGSIIKTGSLVRADLKHYLVPPGTDKRNQKPVQEITFDKEFDLDRKRTRFYNITFTYTDGSTSPTMRCEPQWTDADKGSLAELNYVRSLVDTKKRRRWLF